MKTIIKIFPYLLCLVSYFSYAQDLTVLAGTSVKISDGTIFNVNGLALTPSGDYAIAGPNELTRSSIALNSESINRVFNFSSPLISYQGGLTFFYDDTIDELNGVSEGVLILQSNDGSTWSGDLGAALDTDANTLTHTYTIDDLSSLTASKPGITLSVNKFNELKINLFPNPVISSFQITTDLSIETLIYSNLGQVVFKSKQKNIDVSQLSAGTYLIIVKDIDSNNFNSYQIIKL